MSIVQTQTTSFKKELYTAVHNLSTDVVNIALYTANADLNEDTTVYSATNEVSGTGYTAGGQAMTGVSIAVLDFGSDKTSTTTFTITMPANTSTTALIRSSN